MDNTLDSIRPSDGVNKHEMSYLFGRDPSIITYGQRSCIAMETRKNLYSMLKNETSSVTEENISGMSDTQCTQTIKVFLRLKPFPKDFKLTEEQKGAYEIMNSTTLFTRLPMLDQSSNSFKKSKIGDFLCRKYTFTQTFGPDTTQLELFDQTVKQQMTDFLAGQNCIVMTYGTTNSGKSFTLQGTTACPGIIPRSLEFVFSNITPKATPSYKPVNNCDVISLNNHERAQELEAKTMLLTFATGDKSQYVNTYKQMQKLLEEESPIRQSESNAAHYSVWVSFAEIYNETIYDLLSNDCQKKRSSLKLVTDSNGRTFIKGLKTVCVNSGSEAYQVLMAGQHNLKIAATALNSKSSRSHCIFTIKLLKYYNENTPKSVEVSTFAFCDLAGSERLKKTLNVGDRLKEAQNINTSLLVLGRCLKSIHEGQLMKQKSDLIAPFRESKLTRLFQNALSGKEQISLIVNVNPIPNLYVETQNVLSFSAIAKKIIVEQKVKKQRKAKSRFSQIVNKSMKTVTDWDNTEIDNSDTNVDEYDSAFIHPEDYEELLSQNRKLKVENENLKNAALIQDMEIRQEMADTYTAMLKQLENGWRDRMKDVEEQQEEVLEWSVKRVEDFYKEKLQQLSSRKRLRCSDSDTDEVNDEKIKNLEVENEQLTSKIVLLKSVVKELRETNHILCKEKNTVTFEMSLIKEELKNLRSVLDTPIKNVCSKCGDDVQDDATKSYIEELKLQLLSNQEQVKKLKQYLEEAKEEYITNIADTEQREKDLKEQEEMLLEYEEKIGDLENQLEVANIAISNKSKSIRTLEDELEGYISQIKTVKDEMQVMQTKMEELENEKSKLRNQFESVEETKTFMQTKIDELENENSKLKNQFESLGEMKIDIEKCDAIDDCDNEHSNIIKQEVESDCETSHKLADTQTEKDNEMQEEMQVIQKENMELKEKLADSEKEIKYLKDILKTKETDINISYEADSSTNEKINEKIDCIQVERNEGTVNGVEVACQVEILKECERVTNSDVESDKENDVENKSIQCSPPDTKDEIHQTSFCQPPTAEQIIQTDEIVDKDVEKMKRQLNDLNTEYNVMKEDFETRIQKTTDMYETRMLELGQRLEDKMTELNKDLETCKIEKQDLEKLIEDNESALRQLKQELNQAANREDDKDYEILKLQNEIKNMLHAAEDEAKSDKLMQEEMKSTIKNLTEAREALLQSQQEKKTLEVRLEALEQNAVMVKMLQQSSQEQLLELEQLRNMKRALEDDLTQKSREMDAFMKNRDETVTKYEDLVKSQQEDIERERKEVLRLKELFSKSVSSPSNQNRKLQHQIEELKKELKQHRAQSEKQNNENTDDEDTILAERTTRRRGRKEVAVPMQENSVIELSGSETKRNTHRTASQQPNTAEALSDTKRTTRRRKLHVPDNEAFHEIVNLEETSPVPSSQPRKLRSRRRL